MISKLLVANRGEIACRIVRSCRALGIRTVAVYSDADAQARHVREADEAVRIGEAPARASYLDAAAIVRAALAHGAQAVHPGYGFLSEKLALVDACAAAGLVFVGPHREAIARMGSKIESKRIARAAGLACVPGYDGDDQGDALLAGEAARIGWPLLIKASAGGGGKGMKRVDRAEDFLPQLATARAEALAAFGDERVLLERCIERPRHLEVQLLGDRHGQLVHLFERECSIQRLYQKVIEEAPAAHLDEAVREQLYAAALALGRAIGYDSAGTVEFVLDAERPDAPYFLEMNTRLQVEHPVTELTTGLDLVALQLKSALGEPLALSQADIRRQGWAIEARINAEVPDEGFRASFGPVTAYAEPAGPGLRVDSGIDAASEVTPHYDAMLAKVIAHGATRAVARERLREGLRGLHIGGLQTNQPLLEAILAAPAFEAVLSTRFLAEVFPGGWQRPAALADEQQAVAAAAALCLAAGLDAAAGVDDRPLQRLAGWRLTAAAGRGAVSTWWVGEPGALKACEVQLQGPGRLHVRAAPATAGTAAAEAAVVTAGHDIDAAPAPAGAGLLLWAGGRGYRAQACAEGVALWSAGDGRHWVARHALAARREGTAAGTGGHEVRAELPGVVAQLLVTPGQRVAAGTPVAVLEAMKLFHTLTAPRDGTVASIAVAPGDTVQRGALLVELDRGA